MAHVSGLVVTEKLKDSFPCADVVTKCTLPAKTLGSQGYKLISKGTANPWNKNSFP